MSAVVRDHLGWVTRWNAGPERPHDPTAHLHAAIVAVQGQGGGQLVLWVEQVNDQLDAIARAASAQQWRDLLQMRCPLPTDPTDVATRAYIDADLDAFLDVNNRAFAWHPEQGNMTRSDVEALQQEPWFDADGFRIYEKDGRVAAFCWTKIHAANELLGDPAMGEVYVIAVDPVLHGRGLGKALTLAGLRWLAARGLGTAMLYVEHDNASAVRTYERIGFNVHHVDRAYRITVA